MERAYLKTSNATVTENAKVWLIMINKSALDNIRKPNVWNTYKNPVDNLIHGIIIQAVSDAKGYIQDDKRYNDGSEAIDFLETDGRLLFEYLLTRTRRNESDDVNKHRRYRAEKRAGGVRYRKVI